MLDKIDKFISGNPKYLGLSKPLTAAKVCDAARSLARGRFEVVSFRDGLLTVGVSCSEEAGNLQAEMSQLISQVNQEIGQELVKRLRIKIV